MRSYLTILPLAGFALALASPLLVAQSPGGAYDIHLRVDGQVPDARFGSPIASAGDVDGDGVDDLIVGAPRTTLNGDLNVGSVFVYSGATGAQLYRFDGQMCQDHFGASVASAGDVDGDGFDDLLIGAPDAVNPIPHGPCTVGNPTNGSAYVFSGATGTQLHRFDGLGVFYFFGSSVSGAGDVDGDGFDDLIVGAQYDSSGGAFLGGAVYVFSGATGAQLYHINGSSDKDYLGTTVARTGDLDGDGVGDFIVGAPNAAPNSVVAAGSVLAISGATGTEIFRFEGTVKNDGVGASLSGLGDVDGDGVDDLIVGNPHLAEGSANAKGAVYVLSGATGTQLYRLEGLRGFGDSVAGVGDMDGDGFPDVLVGNPHFDLGGLSNTGSVYGFSGPTGASLFRLPGLVAGAFLGQVASMGDVDGDGLGDFAAGASGDGFSPSADFGSAFIYTHNPILSASAESFSLALGGTIDYALDFPDGDAGLVYGVLLSATGAGPSLIQGLTIPLTVDSFFLASANGLTPSQTSGFQGTLDAEGKATAQFSAAPGSLPGGLAGLTIYIAAVDLSLNFSSVARQIVFTP